MANLALESLEYVLEEAVDIERQALVALPYRGASLIVLDAEDRVQAANRPAAVQYGVSPRTLAGSRLWDLMPEAVGRFRQNIVALARQQGCQFHYLDNLGERWYDTFVEPLVDVAGAVLIRAVDVTDVACFQFSGGHLQFIALQCPSKVIE